MTRKGQTLRRRRPSGLLERERRFIEYYKGKALGNATQAAILAGYSPKTARQSGSRLLTKAAIQRAVKRHEETDDAIMSRIELQGFWSAVTRARGEFAGADISYRLKASEVMGKSLGAFLDRVEARHLDLDLGSMTVEQLRARLEAVMEKMERGGERAGGDE